MTKRRWELGEAPTGRYWEAELQDSVVLTTTGMLGCAAKARRKDHGDEMEAEFWIEQASLRMEGMGYVEVDPIVEVATPKTMHAAPTPKIEPAPVHDDPMEAAYRLLRAKPAEISSWKLLCRDLHDIGDTMLGGLVLRGLAAESDTDELVEWQRWLRRHRRTLYGSVPAARLQISWRNGLPWAVRVPLALADQQATILQAMADAPIFRFLMDLEIQPVANTDELEPLSELPVLTSVRVVGACPQTTQAVQALPHVR